LHEKGMVNKIRHSDGVNNNLMILSRTRGGKWKIWMQKTYFYTLFWKPDKYRI